MKDFIISTFVSYFASTMFIHPVLDKLYPIILLNCETAEEAIRTYDAMYYTSLFVIGSVVYFTIYLVKLFFYHSDTL